MNAKNTNNRRLTILCIFANPFLPTETIMRNSYTTNRMTAITKITSRIITISNSL